MKKQKIVFINQSAGYLMIDIINAFYNSGLYEDVKLITGEVKDKERINKNIPVSFSKKYVKKNVFTRILSWVISSLQSWFLIFCKYRNYHVFLSSNPPIISFLSFFLSNRYSVLIYDLYPEWLVRSGVISEKSMINKLWAKYNHRFFRKADNVFTITDGIANGIKRYSPASNVNVIPVWCETVKQTSNLHPENLFIKKYCLEDKFIVMYSGNMGKGHDMESLVYLAERFREEKDVIFIFSGEGWKKQIINDLIHQLNLENCLVLPRQNKDIFLDFLAAAHIGVVSLTKGAESVSIPSKTYNLLAFGTPILGITEKFSDLYHLITENQVGKCFSSDDISGMEKYVCLIKSGKGNEYEENALKVSKKFTKENASKFLEYSYS